MARIGTDSRLGPAQVAPVRGVPHATEPQAETAPTLGRALVVIDGGRSGRSVAEARPAAGRARAGFIAQLLTVEDPTLLPSRLARTRKAAARYAETARRLA